MHSVGARVRILATSEHHEERRRARTLLVNLLCKGPQICGTVLDVLLAADLHLDTGLSPVLQPQYGIGLKPVFIPVVTHFAIKQPEVYA